MLQKKILYIFSQNICLAHPGNPLQNLNNPESLWQLFSRRNNEKNVKFFYQSSFLAKSAIVQNFGPNVLTIFVKTQKRRWLDEINTNESR